MEKHFFIKNKINRVLQKNKIIFIVNILILTSPINAFTQCNNLVQNGDFENYTTCPSGMVQINVATPWDRLGLSSGTSDYFNSCAGSSGANGTAGTPQNGVGMQIPFSGNGYAGLITYLGNNASGNPPPNPNYREYISQPLSSAMIVGQTYQVSFYVSLSEKQRYAADGMGAYFSTTPIASANNLVLPFTPQVSNPSGNILTDTLGWTQISQNFVATQPFAYITIGNFLNDASTQFIVNNPSFFAGPVAYYYIDDVSVVCLTCCPCTTTTSSQSPTICSGQSITVGSNTYTTTGTYVDTLTSLGGCDSIITTMLTVSAPIITTTNTIICAGDSLFIGGAWQYTSGTYTDTLTSYTNCDSLYTTTLTVLATSSFSNVTSICTGDSLFVGGAWQTISGTYNDTLANSVGCDSVVTTTLTVTSTIQTNANITICAGDSLFIGGNWQTTSGVYSDTLTNYLGCDSILTTTLTVTNAIITNNSFTICSGDSLFVEGAWQTTNGIYTDSLTSIGGCDSIIQTTLTINQLTIDTTSTTICQGDSLFVGGIWQTITGFYSDSLTNITGCDSIVTTNLSVVPPPIANITGLDSVCKGTDVVLTASGGGTYLWSTNETTNSITVNPTSATTYNVVVAIGNCSDTANFTLVINPTPSINAGNNVTINAGTSTTLTATGSNGTYTWSPPDWLSCVICPSTLSTPDETVTYTVTVVDSNGCSTTDSVNIIVNYENIIFIPNIFSPNGDGNNDILYVRGKGIASFQFVMYDRWGEKIFETTDLNTGWNGTFRGKKMNKSVFVYYLKGFFKDGSEFNQKGDVTLIR